VNWQEFRGRRVLGAAAKVCLLLLVAWGVRETARSAWQELEHEGWSASQLDSGWLAAAGALYLAGLAPSGVFWHRVLWTLGQRPRLIESLRAYYIGHLGKYVPGKALVVVLRTVLIRSERVGTAVAAVSVFYETLTMMAAGAFLAGAILAVRFREQAGLAVLAAGLMLCAGVPTLPPVFVRLVRLTGVGSRNPATTNQLRQLRYRTLCSGWLAMLAGWLLIGGSLWAALRASGYESPRATGDELLVCAAAAALAVVAGFLSLIPGGLLVREAVLLGLLTPVYGNAGALVSAVLARLVWLVAEVGISGILYPLRLRTRRKEPLAGPQSH